jgi:hypothetical protein
MYNTRRATTMTAAAIATMATVEAATSTRRFYLAPESRLASCLNPNRPVGGGFTQPIATRGHFPNPPPVCNREPHRPKGIVVYDVLDVTPEQLHEAEEQLEKIRDTMAAIAERIARLEGALVSEQVRV